MTGKKLLWATIGVLACWTLLPTTLSYFWSFQDYFQDWASARNFWEGIAVYSPHSDTVPRYLHEDFAHLADGKLYSIVATVKVNAHPPSSILFFLPFGLLPYGPSYLVWNLISAACLGLAFAIVVRELGITPSLPVFLLMAVLGSLAGPVFEQMVFGQTNAVTLALLALAWRAHRRGEQVQEGCWIGAAAAIKLFPLVLLMIPFGARRWRSLAAAVATVAVFGSLSLTLFGSNVWSEFATKGLPEAVIWSDLWPNASLSGFWRKLFISQNLGNLVAAPSLLAYRIAYGASAAMLILGSLWLVVVRHREVRGDRSYAIGICTMLLLSPTCWPHYYLMLIVPLAILWHEHRESVLPRRLVAAGFLLLFVPAGVYFGPCAYLSVTGPFFALTCLAVQTYTLLGLWFLAVTPMLWKRMPQEIAPSKDGMMPPRSLAA
jgi:hypothetical protein